jgi:hypothetical protein
MREDVRLIILDSLSGLIKGAHSPRIIKNNMAVRPDPLGFRIDDQGLHFGRLPSPQPSQYGSSFLVQSLEQLFGCAHYKF